MSNFVYRSLGFLLWFQYYGHKPNVVNGFTQYSNSLYTIISFQDPVTWYDGESYCSSYISSHLASIHSNNDQLTFLKLRNNTGLDTKHCWNGYNHAGDFTNNNFTWIDGTINDYVNWADGEPSNETEDCVNMWSAKDSIGPCDGCWNDIVCLDDAVMRCILCNTPNLEATSNNNYRVYNITITLGNDIDSNSINSFYFQLQNINNNLKTEWFEFNKFNEIDSTYSIYPNFTNIGDGNILIIVTRSDNNDNLKINSIIINNNTKLSYDFITNNPFSSIDLSYDSTLSSNNQYGCQYLILNFSNNNDITYKIINSTSQICFYNDFISNYPTNSPSITPTNPPTLPTIQPSNIQSNSPTTPIPYNNIEPSTTLSSINTNNNDNSDSLLIILITIISIIVLGCLIYYGYNKYQSLKDNDGNNNVTNNRSPLKKTASFSTDDDSSKNLDKATKLPGPKGKAKTRSKRLDSFDMMENPRFLMNQMNQITEENAQEIKQSGGLSNYTKTSSIGTETIGSGIGINTSMNGSMGMRGVSAHTHASSGSTILSLLSDNELLTDGDNLDDDEIEIKLKSTFVEQITRDESGGEVNANQDDNNNGEADNDDSAKNENENENENNDDNESNDDMYDSNKVKSTTGNSTEGATPNNTEG